ncbi:hypothetical protein DJ010_08175 [Nocardioides silvaticus]|uniref:Uncharacterized protein n=1 Tax=Nocardioides silvaticus TaxID=2201891 RepID=A0A316TIQ3_9ACTN|nr:hypothetical protein [Nocardioides silvaticus]PWN03099.1 hypothetical protein DJ010_08175 [Nocardioides silvaticus]
MVIVMSPVDWDGWEGVNGSFETTVDDVQRAVREHGGSHPFLVYDLYELVPSPAETLPPDPDEERLDQLMRENGGRPIGTWVAYGQDGKMYPFPEPPPRDRDPDDQS